MSRSEHPLMQFSRLHRVGDHHLRPVGPARDERRLHSNKYALPLCWHTRRRRRGQRAAHIQWSIQGGAYRHGERHGGSWQGPARVRRIHSDCARITQILKRISHDAAHALITPTRCLCVQVGKRLNSIGLENTEDSCRAWRNLLFTTAGLGEFISGAILFEGARRSPHSMRHARTIILI